MTMSQTKTRSWVEAGTNTGIGFLINIAVNHFIFNSFHVELTLKQNLSITLIFTIISVVRGYLIRRFFNRGDN